MFQKIKAALSQNRNRGVSENSELEQTRLACAALLVRAAWLDGKKEDIEQEAMVKLMIQRFQIDETKALEILDDANEDLVSSNDIYRYTRVLRNYFGEQERLELFEMLWEVIYSDGQVHDFESNLMRRLAGLLYVSDKDSAQARRRALTKLGLACF